MSASNANHPWRAGFSPRAGRLRGAQLIRDELRDREIVQAELFEESDRRSWKALLDVHGVKDPSFLHVGEGTGRRVPVRYE